MALTNEFGFTVGGVHSSNFNIKIVDIQRNIFPEIQENLLNIPARQGSYFAGLNIQHRVITVSINISALTHGQRLGYIEQIATWLLNPDADQEIVFDDQPDRAYYGHVANSSQVTRGLYNGKATLEIHCSDPFAYAVNESEFGTQGDAGNYLFEFVNSGSADAFPRITTNFNGDASFISYISPSGIILLGNPADVNKTSVPKTQYILNDSMQDVATWTAADQALISGRTVTGSVTQGASGMYVGSFGTGTGWHGPAVRKNLPSTVQDFTVKANIQLASKNSTSSWDGSQMGAIEVYLYDANNVKIGKLTMYDSTANYEYNVPRMEFNNGDAVLNVTSSIPAPKVITQKDAVYYTVKKGDNLWTIARKYGISLSQLESINHISPSNTTIQPGQKLKIKDTTLTKTVYATSIGNYNDFKGQLTLQRIGTTWYAEVKRTDGSSYLKSATYYDVHKKYSQNPLAYVVINFLQYGTNKATSIIEVDSLQVIQNNTVDPSTQNQTIFHTGDELVVDMSDSSVRLNGDLIMDQLDIGSTFFSLIPGTTEVKILTDDDTAGHSATFVTRYLS